MVRPTDGRCKHARGVAPEGFGAYDGADRTHLRLISGPFRPPRGPVRGRIDDVSDAQQHIEALLSERREFPPSDAFRAQALVNDRSLYERADADHEAFWAEQAER